MRVGIALAAAGALMVSGLAMFAVESQVALEGIVQEAGVVGDGAELAVSAHMEGGSGVFAVIAESGTVEAELSGPSVDSTVMVSGTYEEMFEAEEAEYTITVRGTEPVGVVAAIGPVPEGGGPLGVASGAALVSGMALLVWTGARAAWRRRSV